MGLDFGAWPVGMVNLALAAILTGIATYTDIKTTIIYNKHTIAFFLLGLLSVAWYKQYNLLLSAGIIFLLYLFFYAGGSIMSNIAVNLGMMPPPEGSTPMGGGDVKMAVVLALLIGHIPVLLGTVAGALLMVLCRGVKQWRVTGSPSGMVDVAFGRVHAPVAFGPYLGICSLTAAIIIGV